MISFQATTDLLKSAEITYANMRSYYLTAKSLAQFVYSLMNISPAYGLYKRFGFEVIAEDDRFFNMTKDIAQ
ncbi:hypothetical protein HCZ42_15165 [Vibrio hepatarius]|nr:hypothetical protein [Vibrio hepatarius]NVJ56145.1 hypothetical protein [Vibrionaceae bacterium]